MKSKILHISSFLLLFTFISLLIVSSASILSQEEENEEIIEIVLEDFFDEEGVFEVKFFSSNWLSNFNLELDSFDLLLNANIHLLGDYSQFTQSILYPPPEKY